MANFALLLLVIASCAAAAHAQIWGGATSISQYAPAIINKYGHGFPKYDSVGSGAGLAGLLSGKYKIAGSDDPPNAAQYSALGSNRLTCPLTLGAYSFVTKKAKGLKVTPQQAAGVYLGTITKWSQIKAGLTGNIIPVARADGSGTTELVGLYFKKVLKTVWPSTATTTASWKGQAGFASNIVFKSGSGGVAGYTAKYVNGFTYVQAGIGITTFKNFGIAIKNPSGTYVFAVNADPAQSIPQNIPLPTGVWANDLLLAKTGRTTYPIVSFVYLISKQKYNGGGPTVRNFLLFTQSTAAQNIAQSYFFFRLPTKVINQNVRYMKIIK